MIVITINNVIIVVIIMFIFFLLFNDIEINLDYINLETTVLFLQYLFICLFFV